MVRYRGPREGEFAIDQAEQARMPGFTPDPNAIVQVMTEDELRMIAARIAAMPAGGEKTAFQRLHHEVLRARTMERTYGEQVSRVRAGRPTWKRENWQDHPDPTPERD